MNNKQNSYQPDLCVSIVSYQPDLSLLSKTVSSLMDSIDVAMQHNMLSAAWLVLVDNGPGCDWHGRLKEILRPYEDTNQVEIDIITGQGNIGFGRAHNLAINRYSGDYHLVLNPDVILEPEAILECLQLLEGDHEIGLVSPHADNEAGNRQFLCKRYPALADLALRGGAPGPVKRLFQGRISKYEMRDKCNCGDIAEVPIVSGCFMFFRTTILQNIGGFSADFFLYFEDFDISLRAKKICKVIYAPTVRIIHAGGHAAKKGWRHILMFTRSGYVFFRKHGWVFW